jgi:hypothetical protein
MTHTRQCSSVYIGDSGAKCAAPLRQVFGEADKPLKSKAHKSQPPKRAVRLPWSRGRALTTRQARRRSPARQVFRFSPIQRQATVHTLPAPVSDSLSGQGVVKSAARTSAEAQESHRDKAQHRQRAHEPTTRCRSEHPEPEDHDREAQERQHKAENSTSSNHSESSRDGIRLCRLRAAGHDRQPLPAENRPHDSHQGARHSHLRPSPHGADDIQQAKRKRQRSSPPW